MKRAAFLLAFLCAAAILGSFIIDMMDDDDACD